MRLESRRSGSVLATLAVLATAALAAAQTSPGTSPAIRVAVNQSAPSNRIESDFLGLSFEKYILPQGNFDTRNTVLVRLLENLGTGVFRLGGVTVDRTHWSRDPAYTYPDSYGTIRPQDVDRYFAFTGSVDWKTMYGLNLASGLPSMSADEAAYVAQRGGANLLAYQLGNEPDIYPNTGMRAPYPFDTFMRDFDSLLRAVRTRVPNAPVAGPVTAGTAWVPAFLAARSSDVAFTALHFYPAETATMDLLSRARATAASATLTEGANASRQYGKPFRLTETNSAWGAQPSPNLTNTFVNTLWGIDHLFSVAAHGYSGAWVHGGFDDCTHYAPMCRTSTGVYQPLPLYYAMLAFRSVGPGRLLSTRVDTSNNVTAYSVLGDDGRLRVAVINKDTQNSFTFEISPGAPYTSATAQRLTAPSVTARSGITFAGRAVNADGTWVPAASEAVSSSSDLFTVTVPAASAAIVTFNPAGRGGSNIAPTGLRIIR